MKKQLITLALVIALLATVIVPIAAPFAHAQAATSPFSNIPITGTLANGGIFTGTLNITRFATQNGALVAVGSLTGTLTDALGNVIGSVTGVPITLPIASLQGTCQVLHLVLGPLDLNLLGLVVHLNQVVLDITAQSGAGNLLGNLLCAVAGLLDNGGPLQGIVGLLNNILRVLG